MFFLILAFALNMIQFIQKDISTSVIHRHLTYIDIYVIHIHLSYTVICHIYRHLAIWHTETYLIHRLLMLIQVWILTKIQFKSSINQRRKGPNWINWPKRTDSQGETELHPKQSSILSIPEHFKILPKFECYTLDSLLGNWYSKCYV